MRFRRKALSCRLRGHHDHELTMEGRKTMFTKDSRTVPLARPSITDKDIDLVAEALRSGWLAHGSYNERFEEAFAEYVGVPHAVCMNSCTSALEVALEVAGIKGEVVIPSFTWVATANAVVNTGGTPVFCDVDISTRNTNAEMIAACITPKTEAIIVVHYGGQPCPMDAIVRLCDDHGLLLIEDSAETIGATWRGGQAGSFGIGCFSFFPTKNITTGEGGMLTCKDADFAEAVRIRVSHGVTGTTLARERKQKPWLRAATVSGHNFRMPNPLAALGYSQLLRLDEMNARRIDLASQYDAHLGGIPQVVAPSVARGATHVYQMYTVLVDPVLRDPVLCYLRERGIGASVHFDPPVHLQPFYRGAPGIRQALPNTDRLRQELITLPIYPDMEKSDSAYVACILQEAVDELYNNVA
jgi:perosamine synthetase